MCLEASDGGREDPLAGAARSLDKMPLNVAYAGLIHRALPNARIICLRRHPMDAALSNYRQLFATRFPYYDYALDLENTGRYVAGFEALADLDPAYLEERIAHHCGELLGRLGL